MTTVASPVDARRKSDSVGTADKQRSSSIASNGHVAAPAPANEPIERDRKVSHSSGKDIDHQRRDSGSASRKASELKPIGIINEQNTCFLNSTFQALSSTGPLVALIAPSPSSNLYPVQTGLLPQPVIATGRIPCNLADSLEPPLYQLLPVTHAFVKSLTRAWRMKDAGGGTYGSQEGASHRSMSLRGLLRELARKYDQYDDYGQQDAHELLRHLLDSMEMEEKDVVKKLQPQPPAGGKRRRGSKRPSNVGISPMPSPLPSPAPSAPSSPTKQTFDPIAREGMARASQSVASGPGAEQAFEDIPEDKRLVPFVNVLFGGSLASVVVCENCKSVSHTYEGFLDISLSLKSDNAKPRKRDRFKAMANKLIPGKGSSPKDQPEPAPSSHPSLNPAVVMSDTELSDTEPQERDRRLSLNHDDRAEGSLSRNSSLKTFGLRNKKSFSFGKKKPEKVSRPGSSNSSTTLPAVPSSTSVDHDRGSFSTSGPSSPVVSARMSNTHIHGVGPTAAQMAYIHRILAPPPNAAEIDPLTKLRAANANSGEIPPASSANGTSTANETGLEESLRAFTSVEVLEGENAFACKRCWKIKSGRYKGREATLPEEDESAIELMDSTPNSPEISATGLQARRQAPPSISIASSETSSIVTSPVGQDDGRLGRAPSVASRSSASAQNIRAPSPLRRQVEVDDSTRSISNMTLNSSIDSHSGSHLTDTEAASTAVGVGRLDSDDDGLSDTDTSDEEQPDTTIHIGRPKPTRRQSSHFVMRRAFKRYLFAKAPEVLIFHFKRFKQTQKTSMMFTSFYDLKKMDDFVSFPEVLDLAPYMAPNRNDYKLSHTAQGPRAPYMDWISPDHGPSSEAVNYRLYAAVVHLGTMVGGHYIAYCLVDPEKMFGDEPMPTDLEVERDGINNIEESRPEPIDGAKKDRRVWCFCSDTSIRLATVDEVLSARAYMCFYERVKN